MARKLKPLWPEPEPLSPVVTEEQARQIANIFGTPVYVYSQRILEEQADKALAFPNAFGLTVRYAMKANPNSNILKIFAKKGIQIDASSGYEVRRAILAGVPPQDILLTSQQMPDNLTELLQQGVNYTVCSLNQLDQFESRARSHTKNKLDISVRINPGLGSGGTNRTNTGGPASSFGIWHEQIDEVLFMAKQENLNINRIHSHIGSGSDPEVWKKVALMSLKNVKKFLDAGHNVQTLNLGGGYKVARMSYEKETDLQECGAPIKEAFEKFANGDIGRALRLEIEPGTFLVANAGCVIARAIDYKKTPKYNFIITDSGMTEVTRPSLYGAQHPISVIPYQDPRFIISNMRLGRFIVSGHCCESGDILTPGKGDSEALQEREILAPSKITGSLVVIGGTGAYCSGMSTKHYNSYPEAPEVLIDKNNKAHLIRKRGSLDDILKNEVPI